MQTTFLQTSQVCVIIDKSFGSEKFVWTCSLKVQMTERDISFDTLVLLSQDMKKQTWNVIFSSFVIAVPPIRAIPIESHYCDPACLQIVRPDENHYVPLPFQFHKWLFGKLEPILKYRPSSKLVILEVGDFSLWWFASI